MIGNEESKFQTAGESQTISNRSSFVPKVHPATREVEQDDPMELVANPISGDPSAMLDCLIWEFASMGITPDRLEAMFRDPEFPVLMQLHQAFGGEEVHRRIWGDAEIALRVTEEIDDNVEEEPELTELTVLKR